MSSSTPAPSTAIARVEPLTNTRAVRGPFDYKLGAGQPDVEVGSLLRVPFGGRTTLGVVVELAGKSELEDSRLAEPEAVLGAGLPRDLVELAMWLAVQTCSTPARGLGLMLAPGSATGVRSREALVASISERGRAAMAGAEPLTELQRGALERLREQGPAVASTVGTPLLRRLERRGLVTLELSAQRRRPARATVGARSAGRPGTLTADQRTALVQLLDALERRRAERFLLHGVTGSGKTEVYLRAVEDTLRAGRTAIVLVPEIGLTPQAMARFQERFGDVVAVLHSALSRGERYDEWQRLRSGEARVCVGPRSAVFAPLERIGLIVVDEEHDSSYKHEGEPRYDARTVARRRAEQHGAVLLCGSATPRPESAHELRTLRLPERVDARSLPPVEVLDMRGQHHPLHPETRMALADVRANRGKGIVLLNRRGWSNFLSCRACGRVWMCPSCDVSLVLHMREGLVACHHCGHREAVPARCRSCGSAALARHGAGTERLEDELRAALGAERFPIFRLDADVAAGKNRAAATLERFEAAEAGLLIGTQMVAKGHDFPDVTLGVVIDADQTLRFPDFRAEERTFALVTQLAGRAGRGDAGGRVLVQTIAPGARPIVHAARHDSDGFLAEELARRKVLSYPPFGSLIRIVCGARDAADAHAVAAELRAAIAPPGAIVLGPAPLFRLRGKTRSQLVIKAADRAQAIEAVGRAVEQISRPASRRRVSVSVDVDPQ
jgi:primosomal protein N' (replication factor Y) (superfamily II helicase)